MIENDKKTKLDLPDIDISYLADLQKQEDGSFIATNIRILSVDLIRKDRED